MRILLYLGLGYLLYATLLWVVQRRVVFPGVARGSGPPPSTLMDGVERVWFPHDDGRVEGWYLPPHTEDGDPWAGPRPAAVFFHGNGELIDDWVGLLRPFPEALEMGVLLVEYPGYGRSTGSPTQERIMEVARGAWDWLGDRREVDASRRIAVGRSLGGGVAAALTRDREVSALVLQSTFTSVADLARERFFVPGMLVRDPFRTLEAVRGYEGPVLVVHGREDRVVPFRHGQRLADASRRGRLHPRDCGHNDCPVPGGDYWRMLEDFLRNEGVLPAPPPVGFRRDGS